MRAVHKMALTVGVATLSVGLLFGQGFPTRPMGGGTPDPALLLQRPDVRKELKLSDDQLKKVPEAVWKALTEVLDDGQVKRLRQIEIQQRGAQAFTDARVQKALKLTDEQKESIKAALDSSAEEVKELFKEAKGGGFRAMGEKMATIRKETMEKVTGMLKGTQKRAWNDMVGEPFKMENRFGGGFGEKGKGKGRPKKDTE